MHIDLSDFGGYLEGIIVLSPQLIEIPRAHIFRAYVYQREIVILVLISDAVNRYIISLEITVQRA